MTVATLLASTVALLVGRLDVVSFILVCGAVVATAISVYATT